MDAKLMATMIEAMKKAAADIAKVNPLYGSYAWRKINALGTNPTDKAIFTAADDIVLLGKKAAS